MCPSNSDVWQQILHPVEHGISAPPLSACAKVTATKVCIVGRNGILRLFDSTLQDPFIEKGSTDWLRLADGEFFFDAGVNDYVGCAITQGHVIKRTTDGGASWTDAYVPPSVDAQNFASAIAFGDPIGSNARKGVAAGQSGNYFLSADAGASWTAYPPLTHSAGWKGLAFVPQSDTVYASGFSGQVWRSTDAGQSWSAVHTSTGSTLHGVSFATEDVGYVCGSGGKILVTDDAGQTWSEVSIQGQSSSVFFDVATFGSGVEAWAVGTGGRVYHRNGGRFIQETIDLDPGPGVRSPTEDLADVEIVLDGQDVHLRVVGRHGTVLFRDPQGVWTAPKPQTSDDLARASFPSVDHGFVLGYQFLVCEYE